MFKTSNHEVGETAGQYVVRFTNYHKIWMEFKQSGGNI